MSREVVQDERIYEKAPAGTHNAVCVDWAYLGIVETNWNGKVKYKEKIRFYWLIEEQREDGMFFLVNRGFTFTLDAKGHLLPFTQAWGQGLLYDKKGKPALDPERGVKHHGLLTISHNEDWANVSSFVPLPKGMQPFDAMYTRRFDSTGLPLDAAKRAAWEANQVVMERKKKDAARDTEDAPPEKDPWDE
jgi:hypothetical protein